MPVGCFLFRWRISLPLGGSPSPHLYGSPSPHLYGSPSPQPLHTCLWYGHTSEIVSGEFTYPFNICPIDTTTELWQNAWKHLFPSWGTIITIDTSKHLQLCMEAGFSQIQSHLTLGLYLSQQVPAIILNNKYLMMEAIANRIMCLHCSNEVCRDDLGPCKITGVSHINR